jgi:hypothetical protein
LAGSSRVTFGGAETIEKNNPKMNNRAIIPPTSILVPPLSAWIMSNYGANQTTRKTRRIGIGDREGLMTGG